MDKVGSYFDSLSVIVLEVCRNWNEGSVLGLSIAKAKFKLTASNVSFLAFTFSLFQ